ncbi:MAG: type III-A CRISPR-associated RAMP protein Csm5 [Phycisphaerales bacterium]
MTSAFLERWKLTIEPLTPIHIGAGQAVEPFEYTLQAQDDDWFLVAINLPALFASLSPERRAQFDEVVRKGDLGGVRLWLQGVVDSNRHRRFVVQVQAGAGEELLRNWGNPERLGQIELSTRHANSGVPYLPGSALKGAIRTAIVEQLCGSARSPDSLQVLARDSKYSSARFEAAVLGHTRSSGGPDLYADPFRQIAIEDAALPDDGCYIDRVQVVRRTKADSQTTQGIRMYRDMTWSRSDGGNLVASTTVRVHRGMARERAVARALEVKELIAACNRFYGERLDAELQNFADVIDDEASSLLRACKSSVAPNQCIVRLGRHSHFECCTVRKYATLPRRGVGKTRTLASVHEGAGLPLGWTLLTFEPHA